MMQPTTEISPTRFSVKVMNAAGECRECVVELNDTELADCRRQLEGRSQHREYPFGLFTPLLNAYALRRASDHGLHNFHWTKFEVEPVSVS